MVTDHDGFLNEALGRANSHSPDGEEGSSVMKRPLALKDRLTRRTHAQLSLSLSLPSSATSLLILSRSTLLLFVACVNCFFVIC